MEPLGILVDRDTWEQLVKRVEALEGRGETPKPTLGPPVSFSEFAVVHRNWTEGRLRDLWFRRADNRVEASGAMFKRGRRVYVSPTPFFAWLQAQPKGKRR